MAGPDGAWHENVETVEEEGGAASVGDGVKLRLLIREEGATGFAAALLVLKGSLVALAAAHRDGRPQGELAPEGVVVTPAGGIRLDEVPVEAPAYQAPELWRGAPASPASDMYAATAVFFECVTGDAPFHASGVARLGWLHRTAPPPVEQVPEELRRLVERGLAKAPQHRPASAAQFAAEVETVAVAALGPDWERLGRVALAALAAAYPDAVPEPVPPPVARPSRVRIATLVALTAAAVVVVALSAGDRPSRQSNQAASPPPPTRVTLLPTPSFAVVEPVRNSRPLPDREPAVAAEESGSPRTATPTGSSSPSPTATASKGTAGRATIPTTAAPAETVEPVTVPEKDAATPPPPLVPTRDPVLDVEASVGAPLLGGNGLQVGVSLGVQTGLLGLSL
ncbi:hypothetical protein Acor_47050 [Acrocarpospora corrugata]|uniref:non-specific serine/threonine protein kinase n=1 Tax=Acrocarpospora corrugata TaxID=35763 RepID=A0A5M3W2Y3_9ACTN|nr:hypothetical protein [Acrocarpospora corrugata]GES02639.1 hypothetical protein Acor_47050 [Acrocarpospora corrugata]